MPSLGADMDSGTLIAWRVAPGDRVARGQIVAEVDTDKSVIEVETFTAGTVTEILVEEGERVPVGTPLAVIAGADEPPPTATPAGGGPEARRPASSPRARRRAEELGVELGSVTGTGPGGAITADDVERARAVTMPGATSAPERGPTRPAAAGSTVAPPTSGVPGATERSGAGLVVPPAGTERRGSLRRAIAAAMARSKREIPHYYLSTEIDVADTMARLTARNAAAPVTERILPAAVLLRATARALREVPALNGFWEDGSFRPATSIHLGVAIALRGGGLIAPAIHDADLLPLADLMAGLRDLVGRARAGRIRGAEMADPTVTVTDLGDQGVDVVTPVIYPPQVAIVGFGRIRPRPRVVDDVVAARSTVVATLGADHRATDGRIGALFLSALDRILRQPDDL